MVGLARDEIRSILSLVCQSEHANSAVDTTEDQGTGKETRTCVDLLIIQSCRQCGVGTNWMDLDGNRCNKHRNRSFLLRASP